MKEIQLSQGKVSIVDDEDFEELSKYKWCCSHGYAARKITSDNKRPAIVGMHAVIMGKVEGLEIDHINGNRLDNRRENLRHVTRQQNMQNQTANRDGTSKHKGVCWNKSAQKWRSQIKIGGKLCYLGYYKTEQDAAIAYNEAALIHFGAYARLNVIPA